MKPNLSSIINKTRSTISKHSPEILTAIGIAGMATSVILAVKATPKAMDILEQFEDEDLTKIEVVKATWKCYVPAASSFIFAGVCLVGANSVNAKRNTALAAAYKLSEKALVEYRHAVVETIGENKEKEVREKVAKKRLEENPASKAEVIITGNGDSLCYDYFNDRYFESSMVKIQAAVNSVNKEMISHMYVSLSDFYDELDLKHTSNSSEMGWNLEDGLIEVELGSHLSDDGRPCIVINFVNPPAYKFDRFYR